MESLLPTHPSTYKEIIKTSFKLYRASFVRIILISFLLSTIAFIPRIITNLIGQDLFLNLPPFDPHRLLLLPIYLFGIIFFIGIIWRMYCVIRNIHEPFVEDLRVGIKKVAYAFLAVIIQSVIAIAVVVTLYGLLVVLSQYQLLFRHHFLGMFFTTVFLMAEVILIMYVNTLFIFLIPLIAIENKGVLGALERSASLVWNHWWRVFSVQFTPWMTYLILLFILRFVFGIDIHIYLIDQKVHTFSATFLHLVIFAIFIPWVAAIMLVQLKDLELRKK